MILEPEVVRDVDIVARDVQVHDVIIHQGAKAVQDVFRREYAVVRLYGGACTCRVGVVIIVGL